MKNRVPVVFATNSGYSLYWDAGGQVLTKRMKLFEEGHLDAVMELAAYNSLYRENPKWLLWIYSMLSYDSVGLFDSNREKTRISQDGASDL